jgi:hypothetical protein
MSVSIKIRVFGRAFNKRCVKDYLMKPAIKETLDEAIGILKSNTPIDTGRAREGWKLNANVQSIDNDVPYVKFLDLGTYKMKAFNITRNSIPRIKERFKVNIERNIQNLNS